MDFDQLFALRTYYEEEYDDEIEIIKAIKTNMIDNGMSNTDANKLLKEFYDSFGIPLNADDLEDVKSAQQIQNELLTELFGNSNTELFGNSNTELFGNSNTELFGNSNTELINTQSNNILNTLIRNIINPATMNYVENRNLEDNINQNQEEINENQEEINQNQEEINQNQEEINENQEEINQNQEEINQNQEEINQNQEEINENIPNNIPFINNVSNVFTVFDNNSSITYNRIMMTIANELYSELINVPNQENVICTLDEEEKNKLNKVILENNLDKCCSVCMDELVKDNQVIILPCEHIFHTNCIEEWLSKYNYNCPVCKKEVGKPKYNI